MGVGSNDLSQELAVMREVFSDLAARLHQAAQQLHGPGTPPTESLIEELSSCGRDFQDLIGRTRALGESLHVASPPVESPGGLQELSTLLDQIAEAEILQSKNEETRHRALSALERVLLLSHSVESDSSALRACQDRARELNQAIAEGTWNSLPAECESLAEGEHEFAHLLTLVEDRDELSDELWARLHESVGAAFGKSLAAAAARAKLSLALEHAGSSVGE